MKTLTVPADVDRLAEVTAFVDEALGTVDCPAEARFVIHLAVEEIFVNIASYAYQSADSRQESLETNQTEITSTDSRPDGPEADSRPKSPKTDRSKAAAAGSAEIQCEILRDPLRAAIRFLDSGAPYDPTAKEDADTSPDALMNRVGGLGILLVRRTMDEVRYARENGKNILTIVKRL